MDNELNDHKADKKCFLHQYELKIFINICKFVKMNNKKIVYKYIKE